MLTPPAIGRIESKKAVALSTLRGKLVRYWKAVHISRHRQAWFAPEELVPALIEYAKVAFDATAEEYLAITVQSPTEFLDFLRTGVPGEIWGQLQGEGGIWRRVVEDSLTLSGFVFPRVPGRSIRKEEFLYPFGKERFEAALRDRVDTHWTAKSWEHPVANGRDGNVTRELELRHGFEDELSKGVDRLSDVPESNRSVDTTPAGSPRSLATIPEPLRTRWKPSSGALIRN